MELHAAMAEATTKMGFDHFALTYDRRPGRSESHRFLLHNYPRAWAKNYHRFGFFASDPVRRVCEKSPNGFGWREMGNFVNLTQSDHNMMDLATDHGLADGYTVPRHLPGDGGGSCTFAINPGKPFPEEMRYVAELLGGAAVYHAMNHIDPPHKGLARPLTDRQLECLIWSARGKTNAEIGLILDISEETVAQHLRGARERYGVHNRQQLILCALVDGIISFADLFDWRRRH